jgi:hypothetical protein
MAALAARFDGLTADSFARASTPARKAARSDSPMRDKAATKAVDEQAGSAMGSIVDLAAAGMLLRGQRYLAHKQGRRLSSLPNCLLFRRQADKLACCLVAKGACQPASHPDNLPGC